MFLQLNLWIQYYKFLKLKFLGQNINTYSRLLMQICFPEAYHLPGMVPPAVYRSGCACSLSIFLLICLYFSYWFIRVSHMLRILTQSYILQTSLQFVLFLFSSSRSLNTDFCSYFYKIKSFMQSLFGDMLRKRCSKVTCSSLPIFLQTLMALIFPFKYLIHLEFLLPYGVR